MKKWLKRIGLFVVLPLVVLFGIMTALNWNIIQRTLLGGVKVYETEPPALPAEIKRPAILVFSKTNGFRHEEAIPAANALFAKVAQEKGWGYFQTENGATFRPDILARFDAVVFNNVSGDVFTAEQRKALQDYMSNGGGFVGIHGAGGDFKYDWRWYVDEVIGAQFIGHTMDPQFQEGVLKVVDAGHPATAGLPASWKHTEEWYSFDRSVRAKGYNVLIDADETSYKPDGMWGQDLRMGKDHPMVWWHCIGKGRVLYSALGHQARAYSEPEYVKLLTGAVGWAARQDGTGCDAAPEATNKQG